MTTVAAAPLIGGLTVGQGAALAGTVISGISQFRASKDQESIAKSQAAFQQKQLDLSLKREETQAAIEAKDREQRLRSALARQRAAFGAGGVDPTSGSPLRIQELTEGQINREASLEGLASDQRIANINVSKAQTEIGKKGTVSGIRAKRGAALFDTAFSVGKQASEAGLL